MLSSLFLTAALASTALTYGEPITLKEKTGLAQAMQTAPGESEVLIEGRIKKICEKKGCWLTLQDGDAEVRVTFKDYAFFVPKDSGGKAVLAQGRLVEKTESVGEQKHMLEDAGASKKELAAIKEPKKVKSFVASGVQIRP